MQKISIFIYNFLNMLNKWFYREFRGRLNYAQ